MRSASIVVAAVAALAAGCALDWSDRQPPSDTGTVDTVEPDTEADVPVDVRNDLAFVPVETIEDVLREALNVDLHGPVVPYAGNRCVPVHDL